MLLLTLSDFARADFDGDGVEDEVDNCIWVANPSQADAGALLTPAPDGIGDLCQCGDTSGDGLPNILDVVHQARVLAGLLPPLLAPERCDVESIGDCDALDLARLREALSGLPPGLESVCVAWWPQPLCGNDVAEPGELCDGDDVSGQTCASIGHASGPLSCTDDCAHDATLCTPSLLAIAVGDSLVQDYSPVEALGGPTQGWMHDLPLHFATGELIWQDYARSGTSTKSYRDLGHWETALAAQPRWILIELGHNDARLAPDVHTDPNTTYRENLHAMVIEARAIGAEPIFVTPPPYFYAAADGFHVRRPNGMEGYVAAMQAQAAVDSVAVVELHAPLMDYYDLLGISLSRQLYSYEVGQNVPDIVHFSGRGAELAAGRIAAQLAVASPSLAAYLLTVP